MSRVVGPILTTGVALAAAGVVVANPIAVAPRADIQIPAVALSSGSDEMAGMLDEAFLNAIAPEPAAVNPFAVLKDLISALAADATYRGTNAIVEAFVAGVAVISEPELTAAWSPYIPPPADLPVLALTVLPGLDLDIDGAAAPSAAPVVALPDPQPFIAETVVPAVQDLVSTLAGDVAFVGREAIAAAFAAGAVVAAEPVMIYKTLRSLVLGDFRGALTNAVKVVTAPLGPPLMIIDAMRTVVERHLAAMTSDLAPAPAAPQTAPAEPLPDVEVTPAVPVQQSRGARPQSSPAAPLTVTGDDPAAPAPAAAEAPARAEEGPAVPGPADVSETPADPVAEVNDADAAVVDEEAVEVAVDEMGVTDSDVAAPARRAATAVRGDLADAGESPSRGATGAVAGEAGGESDDGAGAERPDGDDT